MRFAYLILAHRDLEQLHALVSRLLRDDPDDRVVIHFDRASPVTDAALARFAAGFGGAVVLTPRTRCRWGHHSLVAAELLLMRHAAAFDYDYAHLISGQDWAVLDKAGMVASLDPGACYLSLETPVMAQRMNDYHLHDRMLGPEPHSNVLRYRLDLALRAAARLWTRWKGPRTCPVGPAWRKGSQWWSLPRAAIDLLVPQVETLVRTGRLRHTLCSDEHVVQTLLSYSRFAERLTDNRRFIKWAAGASSPSVLRAADAPAIRASGAWFARKVDLAVDPFFLLL